MDEGIQVALNGNTVVKILSRWEKGQGVTRILRVQQGEVWVRSNDAQRAVEVETPVGVLAARAAEMSVRLVSPDEAAATVVKGTAEFSTPMLLLSAPSRDRELRVPGRRAPRRR